jgi:hypothetical protein
VHLPDAGIDLQRQTPLALGISEGAGSKVGTSKRSLDVWRYGLRCTLTAMPDALELSNLIVYAADAAPQIA